MWQVEFANDDFHVHAEVILITDDSHDSAAGIACRGRPIRDFDIHDYVFKIVPVGPARSFFAEDAMLTGRFSPRWFRRFSGIVRWVRILHPRGNHDLLSYLLIDRRDVVMAMAIVKDAHDRCVGAMERPNDSSFDAAVRTKGRQLHQHAVAMHRVANCRRRNENVARDAGSETLVQSSGIGYHETEPVAMHSETADDHILAASRHWQRIVIRVGLLKLAATYESLQTLAKLLAAIAVQSEFTDQLFESGAVPGLTGNLLEDG